MTARLLAFAPMVDTELARLVLAHYGVAYAEDRHVFGYASLLALFRAGTVQIPVLTGDGASMAGPRAMVDRYDRICPAERMLVPATQPERTLLEADWDRYNGRLAGWAAPFAYFHLLPLRAAMIGPLSGGLEPREAAVLRSWGYGPMRWLLTTLLRLGPVRAADALAQMRTEMDRIDRLLADGRVFLHGDRITLSDLAVAAALVPLLLPPHYAVLVPALADMPPAMTMAIAGAQARPTARLAERVYAAVGIEPAAVPQYSN